MALRTLRKVGRSSCKHQASTPFARFRAEVYHPVGTPDDIHVVLHNHNGMSLFDEGIEGREELC